MNQQHLLLDPGVVLNLCVVEGAAELLAALPYTIVTTASVGNLVYTNDQDSDTRTYSAEPLVTQGLLGIIEAADQNDQQVRERRIEFACLGLRGALGELAALALTLDGIVATDDPATIALMTSCVPQVRLLSTSALIHAYAGLTDQPRSHITSILEEIQERAMFTPREEDPFRGWWVAYFDKQ